MAEIIDKGKIKEVMLAHLQKIGYPHIQNEVVMREPPTLFRELDTRGLIPRGMDYGMFYRIAVTKYFEAKLKGR
jgi:hypothetical protein